MSIMDIIVISLPATVWCAPEMTADSYGARWRRTLLHANSNPRILDIHLINFSEKKVYSHSTPEGQPEDSQTTVSKVVASVKHWQQRLANVSRAQVPPRIRVSPAENPRELLCKFLRIPGRRRIGQKRI